MNPFTPKRHGKAGPEAKIQEALITKLMRHEWLVQVMIGNELQFGLPDLFIAHPRYGQKWVEVKNPEKFSFTERQQQKFPKLHAAGVGIWVLFRDTDEELMKLFKPANGMEVLINWLNGVYQKGR